jgi:hypothetical protein
LFSIAYIRVRNLEFLFFHLIAVSPVIVGVSCTCQVGVHAVSQSLLHRIVFPYQNAQSFLDRIVVHREPAISNTSMEHPQLTLALVVYYSLFAQHRNQSEKRERCWLRARREVSTRLIGNSLSHTKITYIWYQS